jgi:hypothetical protein
MTDDHAALADAEHAMELIRAFAQGPSAEARQAVLAADPLVLSMALAALASHVVTTVRCPGCGHPVEVDHDPVRLLGYPGPRARRPWRAGPVTGAELAARITAAAGAGDAYFGSALSGNWTSSQPAPTLNDHG